MSTEVLRHRNSLSIRWTTEAGDEWTVAKKFNLSTRILQDATISGTFPTRFDSSKEGRDTERILHYACALAEMMDHIFTRPEDFDRVVMDPERTLGGYPAMIDPRDDGKIYIAIDK